jgi:hypothetical protein
MLGAVGMLTGCSAHALFEIGIQHSFFSKVTTVTFQSACIGSGGGGQVRLGSRSINFYR